MTTDEWKEEIETFISMLTEIQRESEWVLSEEQQRQLDGIQHVGSERAILSIALNNPEALFDISTEVEADDFTNFANKNIYSTMLSILDAKYANISKVNPTIIATLAQQSGLADEINMPYLEALYKMDAGIENIQYYLGKVRQASTRRDAFKRAVTIIDEAIECEDEDADEFIARQEEKFLDAVMKSKGGDEIVRIGDRISTLLDKREKSPRDILGIPTGFNEYDRVTGGLIPGKLKVTAAVAKTGKSAFALNIAKNIAILQGIPVLYVDTEMPTDEQIDRLVSILATELTEDVIVPEVAVTRGAYIRNEKMKEAVDIARTVIEEAPFFHVYMPDFTPEKVHNLARKFQRKHGIDWNGYEKQFVLIFDYIKLPDDSHSKGDMKEYIVLGQIANMLKNKTAGMLNIPVLAFAQLNPRTGHHAEDVNSSHMSGSNRIVMYVNELSFLREKTDDEFRSDGPDNGNLVFKLGETRNGGSYTGWIDYTTRHGVPLMKELKNISLKG
jgi:replicative DNA helicase